MAVLSFDLTGLPLLESEVNALVVAQQASPAIFTGGQSFNTTFTQARAGAGGGLASSAPGSMTTAGLVAGARGLAGMAGVLERQQRSDGLSRRARAHACSAADHAGRPARRRAAGRSITSTSVTRAGGCTRARSAGGTMSDVSDIAARRSCYDSGGGTAVPGRRAPPRPAA
jgi:hypothetical protein